MNKKIVAGAIILSATTIVGLTGCGEGEVETPKYTITFDANNNGVADSGETVIEFKQGATSFDNSKLPNVPEDENGFAGAWESFTMKDENIIVKAKYGDGTQANPYLVSTVGQFAKMLREERLNRVYFKLLNDIDFSSQADGNNGTLQYCCSIDGAGHKVFGLRPEQFGDTNGCLIGEMMGGEISNLSVVWENSVGAVVNNVTLLNNSISNVQVSSAINEEKSDGVNRNAFVLTSRNQRGAMLVNAAKSGSLTLRNCVVNICASGGNDCDTFNAFVGTISENVVVDADNSNIFSNSSKMFGVTSHTMSYTITLNNGEDSNTYRISPSDSLTIPTLDDKNGFAGAWVDGDGQVWSGNLGRSLTLTATHGDGTQQNPYLVANETQFTTLLNEYGVKHTTEYTKDGTTCTEAEADTKIEHYATLDLVYTGTNWANREIRVTNKTYFKVLNNIDVSKLSEDVCAKWFAGEIDFNNNKLLNAEGALFTANEGAMFDRVYDTTIKNLTVELGSNLMTLVGCVAGGENTLENITITNATGNQSTFISEADNNEGPFVFHVLGGTLNMTNCKNEANFISNSSYSGIFVGGYAVGGTKVNFTNCVNSGDITSSGSIGLFFGNDGNNKNGRIAKNDYTITNCSNIGNIRAYAESHILITDRHSRFNANNEYASLDNAEGYNAIEKLSSSHIATIQGYNILVASSIVQDAPNSKYQLVISAFAENDKNLSGYKTLRTNIKIRLDGNSNGVVFENVVNSMMDKTTYVGKYGNGKLSSAQWINIDGYVGVKYFVDEENHIYVVDYSGFEQSQGLQNNVFKIDIKFSNCEKLIIVEDENNTFIDFVVNMGSTVSETSVTGCSAIVAVTTCGGDDCGNYYGVGITTTEKLSFIRAEQDGQTLEVEIIEKDGEFEYIFELINPNCMESPVTITYFAEGSFHTSEISLD